MQNNKRIAKNTIFLYIRMFLTLGVGIYTSRIVLRVLGASDFGLYNVIGGILTMFTMFSASLTIGTNRFLAYAIGEDDKNKLEKTFSMALYLHLLLAILVLFLLETFGLWFLNTQMNIPEGRENAAFWVYQFTVFAFAISLVQVPFQASIVSHEQMGIYAYMSIYDVVMKLLIIILLQYVSADKLILFAFLVFIIQISSISIYNVYCQKHYQECKFAIRWDSQLAKKYVTYSGWNLIGGSQAFFTNQGVNILLNIFCGTVVNAARGLAMNVNNYVLQFINNFQMAANPQIIKLYAAKDFQGLFRLVINNCRIAEYLYLMVAIPIFIEIDYLLYLWLGDYPENTSIFVQIVLIQSALTPLNNPVGMIVHATGKMKWLSIASLVLLLIFPVSYLILKAGLSPVWVFIASAVIWIWSNISQIYFAHRYTGISYLLILKNVYFNTLIGGIVMFSIPFAISQAMPIGLYRFFTVVLVSITVSVVVFYYWGLTAGMREMVNKKIFSVIRNLINRKSLILNKLHLL